MPAYRHGQWLTFALAVEGAHQVGGRSVGIYQASKPSTVSVNGVTPETPPEHVVVVKPSGDNLTRLSDDGNAVEVVRLSVADCPDLKPLDDAAHLPPGRVVHEGWTPRR